MKKRLVFYAGAAVFATAAQAQPDYGPAHWVPCCNANWYTSGNGHSFCVIHDMEGYYGSTISFLTSCSHTSSSVYYAVNGLTDSSDNGAPPGDITQMVRESNYAWHVICWNTWMFGTEHEGFASNPAWYTTQMYQASAGLQRHLCDAYGIPKDRNHIIAHGEWQNANWKNWMAANFPSINTSCNTHTDPGPYWDWNYFMTQVNGTAKKHVVCDFNGDGKTDVSVWHPATQVWSIPNLFNLQWGWPGDIPIPGDYNGDGITDVAVFHPTTQVWDVRGIYAIQWGWPGDVPVPGDYNGDGTTDIAVWHPATQVWSIRNQYQVQWGWPGDIPVPGDYNGDGVTDIAVWHPSTQVWDVRGIFAIQWGWTNDIPVPGDYNGDGKTDPAVYHPGNQTWSIYNQYGVQWGWPGDIPVPGDYNGDGITDVAVWHPGNQTWAIYNQYGQQWGWAGDIPLPLPYAIWRCFFVPPVIIDNPSATVVGAWTTGTSSSDKYGTNYIYKSKGAGTNYVQYIPNVMIPGDYQVLEWHPAGSNRTAAAPYVIHYNGGTSTVLVNQQINGGQWNSLGTFNFANGTANNIQITDGFTDSGSVVMADAIQLIYVGYQAGHL